MAGDHQLLPHHRQRNRTHHRDVLPAAHIQPQHSIAIFIILVHHRTDGPLKDFHFLVCQSLPCFLTFCIFTFITFRFVCVYFYSVLYFYKKR